MTDLARYQDPLTIQRVLHTASTIAIVGLSDNELRASYFVGYYLRRHGYRVIPVNPRQTEILGQKCYASLLDIPEPVDVVNVFRAPDALPGIARDAVAIHAGVLWCQFGVINADGARIAFVGFDDQHQGYQIHTLYVMNRDGTGRQPLTPKLDREIHRPVWSKDAAGIYFQYDDHGTTRIGLVSLDGAVEPLAADLGGELFDRPYSGGSFTVAADGTLAFTQCSATRPADVAVRSRASKKSVRLTTLNDSLLGDRTLGEVEEIEFESSHDRRKIQGWVVKPPDFEAKKKYPLILEIHGGPYANYGGRFSAEMQLYAAAGYVVIYINPRGSTGYGEEFAQLINNNYPGNDYDDLMSAVDAVAKRGFIDTDNLFVTGGSGGGVLTAWIVGKTARFRAAVSCKPVINWYSHALTADEYPFFTQYWFTGPPWEHTEEYMKRSPISLVGNVTTPTMLLTGEEDYRTPISESEQYYQALKLRKVDTALVRIPGSSHDIGARPSQIIAKTACILKWFETHRQRAAAGKRVRP